MYRKIIESDRDNSGFLSKQEFECALNSIGVFFKNCDATALFLYYDKNRDGQISYNEFLDAFRVELNSRRVKLVEKLFKMLDIKRRNKVSLSDAAVFYRESTNEKLIKGQMTKQEAIDDFFSFFTLDEQGDISREEFYNYYQDVGSVTGNDDNFVDLIKDAWGIVEDTHEASEDIVMKYINLLREKLINRTTGVSNKHRMEHLFNGFDLTDSSDMSYNELAAICIKLGVDVPDNVLLGLFNKFSNGRKLYTV